MELDGEGNVKARYVYGLGLIGREDADGTYLSYHYDLRGSTTLLTDEQNRVTDRYTYGLYGELEQHEGVTSQPFAYNGRDGVMTDANGLYYMRARYYDPKLKRFLNRDVIRGEIQDGQTFNRYAYVNGNPVSYIDPLGLMKCETGGTGKNDDFAKEPFLPDEYYQGKNGKPGKNIAPIQGTPGERMDFRRLGSSGEVERSIVIYDLGGKQKYRVDFSDHGNTLHHPNPPHLHEYTYQDAGKSIKERILYTLDTSTGRMRKSEIDPKLNELFMSTEIWRCQ